MDLAPRDTDCSVIGTGADPTTGSAEPSIDGKEDADPPYGSQEIVQGTLGCRRSAILRQAQPKLIAFPS